MSTTPGKTVLITGANAGIGKEVARQLALRPEMARIYLACRNQDRATTAKAELEAKTGRTHLRHHSHGRCRSGLGPRRRGWHQRIRRCVGDERWCHWPTVDGLDH